MKILSVGHVCADLIYYSNTIPSLNNKVSCEQAEIVLGGNAANVARTLKELGAEVDLCSVVGNQHHPYTQLIVSFLNDYGVNHDYLKYKDTLATPSSIIIVNDKGERTVIYHQSEEIKKKISLPVDYDYDFVCADNHRLPMVTEIFAAARMHNISTMLDIDAPIETLEKYPQADYVWLSYETYAACNESIIALQRHFGGVVGYTNSEDEICWIEKGETRTYQPDSIQAVNTLGAGDVFRARFAVEIVSGAAVEQAVESASLTAARHCQNLPITVN